MNRAAAPLASVVLLLAVGALGACASLPPASVCVPELRIEPQTAHPGDTVTVATEHACPRAVPEGIDYEVHIQPDDATSPRATASVSPESDGSFEVTITVPPDMPPGRAIAWISNFWDYAECPDNASCASAEGYFEVSAR